jgi:crossover junction endodeoxyribonuclease RuvC
MFSFGVSYGVVQGVLASLFIPYILVRPAEWKKRAGLIGAEKDKARTIAQQLYPQAELARKRDVGRADAILIARHGAKP